MLKIGILLDKNNPETQKIAFGCMFSEADKKDLKTKSNNALVALVNSQKEDIKKHLNSIEKCTALVLIRQIIDSGSTGMFNNCISPSHRIMNFSTLKEIPVCRYSAVLMLHNFRKVHEEREKKAYDDLNKKLEEIKKLKVPIESQGPHDYIVTKDNASSKAYELTLQSSLGVLPHNE